MYSSPTGFRRAYRLNPLFCVIALLFAASAARLPAAPAVWTEHNDNGRTGQNLSETTLTTSNVNQTTFGKLWSAALDDEFYSQPLYVPSLTVGGSTHNVVYVTSVNDSVYAFDADSGAQLWHVNLVISGQRPPNHTDASAMGACGGAYNDFQGNMGLVGTPVIDTTTNTMYVVARSISGSTWTQQLHALDITSGAEKFGGPVNISGSANGATFSTSLNNQRPALTLVNGTLYIGWSSHCDNGGYSGFVMSYNASNLAQTAVWSDTGAGGMAGIWMGGQGLTADGSNNLYLMTGNGTFDGASNFGESFVKLSPALSVLDYFTPSTWSSLNGGDYDLGSAGALGIPGTSYIFGGGKIGTVYLVNTANMGHENSTDNVVQEFQATFPQSGATGHIHGGPVYYNTGSAQYVYLWGENDFMRCFQFNGSSFNSSAVATSTMRSPTSNIGMPGGFLSVSANGTSNGIVWALTPFNGDANQNTVQGILHAFTATPAGGSMTELWNSQQNATRDSFGNYAKFTYPTVSNGKVYVPTFGSATSGSGTLVAYGLLSAQTAPSAPTGVAVFPENAKNMVYWVASTGATSYNVYRSTSPGAEGSTPVASGITFTSYEDSGLTNGTTYYYKVAAVNTAGTSAQSSEVSTAPNANNGPIANGTYSLTPGNIAGSRLDANAQGTTNGTKVQIWTSNSSVAQSWILTNEGGGLYKVQPSYDTALALDVSGSGLVNGTVADLWTDNSTAAQRWKIVADPSFSGMYELEPSYVTTSTLDVAAGGTADGTQVDISGITNVNYQAWTIGSATTTEGPYGGTAAAIPGTVQAENYDTGGQGVGYNVTTVNGTANTYRSDGVDLEATTDTGGGDDVGWSAAGQWFRYTVNVATAGTYTVTLRVANGNTTNGTFHLQNSSGTNLSGTITVAPTGGWETWTSVTASVTLPAGQQVLTWFQDAGGFNLNWMSFASGTTIPGAPTNLAATAGNAQVSLTWTGSTGATAYSVYRGTSSGGEGTTSIASGITSTSYTNTGLTNGTTYYYKVAAADSAGTSGQSNEAHAAPTSGVPSAPTGLTATSGNAQVSLSWTGSSGATAYSVYRGTSSGGEGTTSIASGIASTSYTNTGLTNGTTYYYKVAAANSSGTSGQSNEASATPSGGTSSGIQIACGNTAQGTFVADTDFSGGAASSGTTSSINLTKVTNPAPMAVYQHGRKSTCTYTIPNLTAGSSYNIRLDFCEYAATASGQRTFNVTVNGASWLTNYDIFANAGGEFIANAQSTTANANSSGQIVLAFTTVVNNVLVAGIEVSAGSSSCSASPSAVTGLAASGTTSTSTNLSWSAVTPPSGCSISSYTVYENSNSIGTATGTSFTVTGLNPSVTYTFNVAATDSHGTGGRSSSVNVTTSAGSCSASPSAPTGLAASGTTSTSTNLSWSAVTPPANCSISSYTVYKNSASIGTTTSTSFSVTGLSASTTYTFTVAATDSSGTSGQSSGVNVTTSSASCSASPSAPTGLAASGTTSTSTNLSWTAVSPPANCSISSYTIYKGGTSIGTSTSASFSVTGLTASTAYTFTVAATDSFGTSAQSAGVNVTTSSSSSICTGVAAWSPNSVSYTVGNLVTYNGNEYKCIQAHTSQAGWDPVSGTGPVATGRSLLGNVEFGM